MCEKKKKKKKKREDETEAPPAVVGECGVHSTEGGRARCGLLPPARRLLPTSAAGATFAAAAELSPSATK